MPTEMARFGNAKTWMTRIRLYCVELRILDVHLLVLAGSIGGRSCDECNRCNVGTCSRSTVDAF